MSQIDRKDPIEQGKQSSDKSRRRDEIRAILRDVGRYILSLFVQNWGTKLLSLVIAVALWAGLIAQDPTLTRVKQFENVAISVIGADTLKRNGFIVLEDLPEVLGDVTLVVNVPQGQYSTVQASNYSVRIDLSRIRETGRQEVRILSTNSSTSGTVSRIFPSTVTLTVDEYITRYHIPVTVERTGEMPDGFWADEPDVSPAVVAVSGPKSLVEKIASVRTVLDQRQLPAREGKDRRAVAFELVDSQGDPVKSDLIEVTGEGVLLDSVTVETQVYPLRTVELSTVGLVKGTPAPGYEVKGVYITPAVLHAAGRSSVLQDVSLFYTDAAVSVEGLSASINASVKVRQSALIKYISADQVNVAVEIGPLIVDRSWSYVPVTVQNLQSGLDMKLSTSSVTFHATGAQLWLDSLSRADLSVRCDMSSVTGPGTYTLPLVCQIGGDDSQQYTCMAEPSTVQVTVTKRIQ